MNIIEKAKQFAIEKHKGQFRKDGTPYVNHPLRVGEIVRKFKESHEIDKLIAAAILHDTLEDTDTTIPELKENFGKLVTLLVIKLTSDKLVSKYMGKTKYLSDKLANEEKFDSWSLVIKLADRFDNISDLNTSEKEFAIRYKKETEDILDNLEKHRKLSETHKKLIKAIKEKLAEAKI